MMIKSILFSLVLFISSIVSAQSQEEKKYLLTTNANTFGLSILNLTDPYLSPMDYLGIGIRYEQDKSRFLSLQKTNISMMDKLSLMFGTTSNPAYSASMEYFGLNYGWGLRYHFRPIEGLLLLAGGLWNADFGIKMITRNVNNPYNFDLNTNLNLSGMAIYDIRMFNRVFHLQLAIQSPILGCMFVPEGGASYYEIFELGNLSNTVHFSSLHNKRGINGTLSVDVPFKRSNWRLGMNFLKLKYSANEMVFKHDEFTLVIGKTFDVASFAGRKNIAPQNFISTYKNF